MNRKSRWPPSPEGELLREFRVRANITQARLSERMGTSNGYVAQVECGAFRARPATISRFAVALKLSLAEEQQVVAARKSAWRSPRRRTITPGIVTRA